MLIEEEELDLNIDEEEEQSTLITTSKIEPDGELCVLPVFDYEQYESDTLQDFQKKQNESRLVDQLINLLIRLIGSACVAKMIFAWHSGQRWVG